MEEADDVHVDVHQASVYLTSVVGRPVGVAYVRVLAQRHRWSRINRGGMGPRVLYRLSDVEVTADRMTTGDHVI